MLTAVYGWPIMTEETPIVKHVHAHVAHVASTVVPGASFVDYIPAMKYLPTWMAKWKRDGLEWHKKETEMFERYNAEVAEKMVSVLVI